MSESARKRGRNHLQVIAGGVTDDSQLDLDQLLAYFAERAMQLPAGSQDRIAVEAVLAQRRGLADRGLLRPA